MTIFTLEHPITGEIVEFPGCIVTCPNPECENGGIDIEVADNGGYVICGPCGGVIKPASGDAEVTPT